MTTLLADGSVRRLNDDLLNLTYRNTAVSWPWLVGSHTYEGVYIGAFLLGHQGSASNPTGNTYPSGQIAGANYETLLSFGAASGGEISNDVAATWKIGGVNIRMWSIYRRYYHNSDPTTKHRVHIFSVDVDWNYPSDKYLHIPVGALTLTLSGAST